MANPMGDRFFKMLGFFNIEHISYLLNSFLKFEEPVEGLEYFPTELIPLIKENKLSIVDLMFRDSLGRYFIIEMQQYPFENLVDRLQYNAAKVLSRSLAVSQKYGELKDVYTICFLNYNLFLEDNNYISWLLFQREGEHKVARGKLHFLFVEIKKWEKLGKFDSDDIRSYWLLFFTNPQLLKSMIELMTPEQEERFNQFCKIVALWDTTQYTEAQLRGYEHYIDEMRVTNSIKQQEYDRGIEKGEKKGIEKGIEKGFDLGSEITMEILYFLKEERLSISEIAEKFNVSNEKVENIKKKFNSIFG
jgi:predicted transposase/invertase (TIGR01784 family)